MTSDLNVLQARSAHKSTRANKTAAACVGKQEADYRDTQDELTMDFPTPLISGTIGYLVLALLGLGGVFGSRAVGVMDKDQAAIGNVVVVIAAFGMWLFWLCAWLHQWHPLIAPIYEG